MACFQVFVFEAMQGLASFEYTVNITICINVDSTTVIGKISCLIWRTDSTDKTLYWKFRALNKNALQ